MSQDCSRDLRTRVRFHDGVAHSFDRRTSVAISRVLWCNDSVRGKAMARTEQLKKA